MENRVKEELWCLAEPEYQKFSSRLIPNIDPNTILGVRLPKLRNIAKKIARGDWRSYLQEASEDTFEEIMIQGMVIGGAKMEIAERISYVRMFLPKINNWSVCDSFCTGLKEAKKYPTEFWELIEECIQKKEPYRVRFGVVMLICHFMKEESVEETLRWLDGIRQEDYYVKMAVAWAVSVYYVHFPQKVMPYLRENQLDDFTYNKALQKITESLRVGKEEKSEIRNMKRKRTV